MKFRNLFFSALVALGASFTGVSIAEARDAVVTGTVNMRTGPGTEYRVIDRLRRGERVRIERCSRSGRWCEVRRRGPDGWVSSRYLRPTGGGWRPGGGGHHGGGHRPGGGGHHGGGHHGGGHGGFCFYGPNGYFCFGG